MADQLFDLDDKITKGQQELHNVFEQQARNLNSAAENLAEDTLEIQHQAEQVYFRENTALESYLKTVETQQAKFVDADAKVRRLDRLPSVIVNIGDLLDIEGLNYSEAEEEKSRAAAAMEMANSRVNAVLKMTQAQRDQLRTSLELKTQNFQAKKSVLEGTRTVLAERRAQRSEERAEETMEMQRRAEERTQREFAFQEELRKISSMSDQELQAALKSEKFSKGLIEKELQERKKLSLTLKSAELALAANDFALQQTPSAQALEEMNEVRIQEAIKEAETNGGIYTGPNGALRISLQDLKSQATALKKSRETTEAEITEFQATVVETKMRKAAEDRTRLFLQHHGAFTQEQENELLGIEAQIAVRENPTNLEEAKALKALLDKRQETIKKATENFANLANSEEAKNARRELVQNGVINNPTNAVGLLIEESTAIHALAGSKYEAVAKTIGENYNSQRNQKLSFGPGSGSSGITEFNLNKPKEIETMKSVVSDNEIARAFHDKTTTDYFIHVMRKLAKDSPVFQQTFRDQEVYIKDGTFNLGLLLGYLNSRTEAAIQKHPELDPVNYTEIFLDNLSAVQNMQTYFVENTPNYTVSDMALLKIFSNNNLPAYLSSRSDIWREMYNASIRAQIEGKKEALDSVVRWSSTVLAGGGIPIFPQGDISASSANVLDSVKRLFKGE